MSLGGTGGVGSVPWSGGIYSSLGASVPPCRQGVWEICAAIYCQGSQPSIRFEWMIAKCISITAFTYLYPWYTTPCRFIAQSSAISILICPWDVSIVMCTLPHMAMLAIFNPRCVADYWSSTRPLCVAKSGDRLNTCMKLVAAWQYESSVLPLPYMSRQHSRRCLTVAWTTIGDVSHWFCASTLQIRQHPDLWFQWLCWEILWGTREVSHYRQLCIGYVALCVLHLYIILSVHGHLPWEGYTHIIWHAGTYTFCFPFYIPLFCVFRGSYFY
jgi:hypothetical protein